MIKERQPINEYNLPYLYSGQTTLTANSTGQIIFQVTSDFSFVMESFTYLSSVNNANSIPTFDIQIMDNDKAIFFDFMPNEFFTGLMRELSTAPDTRYVMGIASNWFRFSKPYIFPARASIIINVRDTSGQANTIRIGLNGYRKYKMS